MSGSDTPPQKDVKADSQLFSKITHFLFFKIYLLFLFSDPEGSDAWDLVVNDKFNVAQNQITANRPLSCMGL